MGRARLVGPPVAQHQHGGALLHRAGGSLPQPAQAFSQASFANRKERVYGGACQALKAPPRDAGQAPIVEHRAIENDLAAMVRTGRKEVFLRSEKGAQGHHQRLPDGVDGRVRHLSKQLLEVRVQELRSLAQHRERAVVAHRSERLLALDRHRREKQAQVLLRVAVNALQSAPLALVEGRTGLRVFLADERSFEIAARHQVGGKPRPIWTCGRKPGLEFAIFEDAPALRIDDHHPSGRQTPETSNPRRRNIHCSRLGGEDHQVVGG